MKKTFLQSGQALVLILLSLSVVLTIILFILSRSVTDIATSTEQADSIRAFSAAEAGVEKALIVGTSLDSTQIGDATYSVDVSNYSEGTTTFNYPIPMISGDTMTTWFVSHDGNGNMVCSVDYPCFTGNTMKVCWGNPGTDPGTDSAPAIEVSVFYETTPGVLSTVKIARATYDPFTFRNPDSNFDVSDNGTCQIDGVSYAFHKTFTMASLGIPAGSYNVQNGLIFARVRMFYNSDGQSIGTSVDFAGNSTLPSQGLEVISTGTSGAEGNQSNRRVSVFKGWPEFPFSALAIFAPMGITK